MPIATPDAAACLPGYWIVSATVVASPTLTVTGIARGASSASLSASGTATKLPVSPPGRAMAR